MVPQALRRWSLRLRQFGGDAETLDGLYARPDPWNFAGDTEQARFLATNALIASHCPKVESLLEIGCGEGFQTMHFNRLAQQITGIDISETAILRAKARLPGPIYLEGTLASLLPELPLPRYDIVTLCEVLVYGDDQAKLIADAQRCADRVFVSNFEPQSRRLAPLFAGAGWQELTPIVSGRKRWNTFLWTMPPAPGAIPAA